MLNTDKHKPEAEAILRRDLQAFNWSSSLSWNCFIASMIHAMASDLANKTFRVSEILISNPQQITAAVFKICKALTLLYAISISPAIHRTNTHHNYSQLLYLHCYSGYLKRVNCNMIYWHLKFIKLPFNTKKNWAVDFSFYFTCLFSKDDTMLLGAFS